MYKIKKISNENKQKIRISFFGDSGVGKTCILRSLFGLEYNELILYTIGVEKIENRIKLNNDKEIKVIIWDTAGAERFRCVSLKNIKYSDGCIKVFDVTSKTSFENLSIWLNSIKEENPNFNNIILFGNKIDEDKYRWKVTKEEINKFIEENKLKYFEVSAKDRIGIQEGIEYIANEICAEKEYIIIPPRKK